jgi:hypothetical protein
MWQRVDNNKIYSLSHHPGKKIPNELYSTFSKHNPSIPTGDNNTISLRNQLYIPTPSSFRSQVLVSTIVPPRSTASAQAVIRRSVVVLSTLAEN